MSATTRKNKLARAVMNKTRREAMDRLRGTGPDVKEIDERARFAVAEAWGFSSWSARLYGDPKMRPPPVEEDESPWFRSPASPKPRLRASWEHLRKVLPDVRRRKAWGVAERTMYEACMKYELAVRRVLRSRERSREKSLFDSRSSVWVPELESKSRDT